MARQLPDYSFQRDGRPLKVWLLDLVAEDAPTRLAAGEALRAMMYGVPSVRTNLADVEWESSAAIAEQGERFKDAVRAAAKSPELVRGEFVRKLIRYRIDIQRDWNRRVEAAHAEDNAPSSYEDRLVQRLQSADGEAERVSSLRRYLKWVCARMKRNVKRQRSEYDGAESMAASGMAAFTIFRVLDDALLADRAGLRAMLAYPQMRGEAAEALVRIGPPAVDFADVFFEGLDSQKSTHSFAGAAALGAIGRDHPDVIDGLLRRLRSGPVAIRRGAAETLHYAGPPLAGRLDIAIDMLLGASRVPGLTCAAVFALGPLGRDSEAALRRVLELAGPRPVRLRAYEGFPDHQYDEVMFERGLAIHALRQFTRFADQVVPALVEALDSFKEYDSDLMQESGHERVCEALGPFGPLAAPAVPRLVRILEDWAAQPERPCEQPKDVFRVLAAIGPAAVAALPTLERLRPMLVDDESAELDPDEPVDRAISSLRQATENG